jgi:hypothetical protein
MLKTTESGKLSYYIRSLREIESLLIQAQTAHGRAPDPQNIASLPLHWQEVFHMARIAPALLLCLKECKSLLEQTYQTLAGDADTLLSENELDYLETMKNVLDSCEQTIEVANNGATPPNQTLH